MLSFPGVLVLIKKLGSQQFYKWDKNDEVSARHDFFIWPETFLLCITGFNVYFYRIKTWTYKNILHWNALILFTVIIES